ncbi:MAG: M14 family zinc carboxypeptidase [Daejeonella sp.]
MSQIIPLLHSYHTFHQEAIKNRFFKHSDLLAVLDNMRGNAKFEIREVGKSFQGRSLNLVKCGSGPVKVFLWSQMHGNEATATMALVDLFNFLGDDYDDEVKDIILKNCTLYILPIVNPDGAEVFNRRNAQEIDINRDFHAQQTPEGRVLRQLRDEINPQFGFNLHDQTTMWSAGDTGNPATISLLAPAYNAALSVNTVREMAMLVIAEMNSTLQEVIPGHVGRFDDEYEPRAFGDNFQAAGTSTILIEAGGYADDPEKQHIRKLVFISMISGLMSISERSFLMRKTVDYFDIPENKLHHFQILLRNCAIEVESGKLKVESGKLEVESREWKAESGKLKTGSDSSETRLSSLASRNLYKVDLGLIAKEIVNDDLRSMRYEYVIGDIGDLSNRHGYKELDCTGFSLIQTQKLQVEELADIVLLDGLEVLLVIEKGVITSFT